MGRDRLKDKQPSSAWPTPHVASEVTFSRYDVGIFEAFIRGCQQQCIPGATSSPRVMKPTQRRTRGAWAWAESTTPKPECPVIPLNPGGSPPFPHLPRPRSGISTWVSGVKGFIQPFLPPALMEHLLSTWHQVRLWVYNHFGHRFLKSDGSLKTGQDELPHRSFLKSRR